MPRMAHLMNVETKNIMEELVSLSDLPGFEAYTRHSVSRDGKFCTQTRLRRYSTWPRSMDQDGHVQVRLEAEGERTRVRLASLIALAFLEARPTLAHSLAYHDRNVMNCAADNLFWQADPAINLNASWKPVKGYPGYDISDEGQVNQHDSLSAPSGHQKLYGRCKQRPSLCGTDATGRSAA